jgi:thermitase
MGTHWNDTLTGYIEMNYDMPRFHMRKSLVLFLGLSVFLLSTLSVLLPKKHVHAQDTGDDDVEVVNIKRGPDMVPMKVLKEVPAPDTGKPSRSGSLLIKFRSLTNTTRRDSANSTAGVSKVEKLYLPDTVRVHVNPKNAAKALELYRKNPFVEYAETDQMAYVLTIPNDSRFSEQWGMSKINAPLAWDMTTGNQSVRIAVVDCGIYDSASAYKSPDGKNGHPDIRTKVIARKNFSYSSNTDDFCNHGTHVAGIAAAVTNNGIGVAGVGNTASLINVKVLGDTGSGSFSWIINGILWAAGCDTSPCGQRRADIINMSLGATGSCTALVQSAIDRAWAQGLVIVAAGGNNNSNGAITPANCNHVIGVASSDQNDLKSSFSNYGSGVDVAAPGSNILSTDNAGGYVMMSGTSMASPHVAGLAALVWSTVYNT